MAAKITEVEAASLATFAQGELADSATQPEDLGTAAAQDVAAFATGAEGDLATTATQPEDLGTAAVEDVGAFATAAQGVKADAAAPKASPTFTGDVKIPDANADGEALAYDQFNARLANLILNDTGAGEGHVSFHDNAVLRYRVRRLDSTGAFEINQYSATGVLQRTVLRVSESGDVSFPDVTSFKVPDGNADGEALAHSQAGAVLNGLTSTGSVLASGATGTSVPGSVGFEVVNTSATSGRRRFKTGLTSSGFPFMAIMSDDGTTSEYYFMRSLPDGTLDLTENTAVTVPVPTTTGHALRQGSDATVGALTATSNILIDAGSASLYLNETDGTPDRRLYEINANTDALRIQGKTDANGFNYRFASFDSATGSSDLTGSSAVKVPAPTTTGHALRQGSNATVAALTATGGITASGAGTVSLRVGSSVVNVVGLGSTVINRATSTPGDSLLQVVSSAGTSLRVDVDGAEFTVPVIVPAATAATHAAQVSAIDAATGKYEIGGKTGLNSTGQRNVTSLLANGWTADFVTVVRHGQVVEYAFGNLNGSSSTDNTILIAPVGFRSIRKVGSTAGNRSATELLNSASDPAAVTYTVGTFGTNGEDVRGDQAITEGYGSLFLTTIESAPATLPGTAL
jgi:hypothetical protein